MNYTQDQINQAQQLITDLNSKFIELEEQNQQLKIDIQEIDEKIISLTKSFGWKEKMFGGNFGGNKKLVQDARILENEKNALEIKIKDSAQQSENKSEKIEKEFSNFLKEIDPEFNQMNVDRSIYFHVYKASKKYKDLLQKAKQGIIDALLFLSWDKLINHPEANEKLNSFKKETQFFQNSIDQLDETIKKEKVGTESLTSLIKFESQDIAMKSFDKLLKVTNTLHKYTDRYLTDNKKLIQEYRSTAYDRLIKQKP